MGSQPGTAIPICARAIEALAFGIKGVAAHADHAWVLGQKDDAAFALIHNTLAATVNPSITLDGLMDLILECGRINLRAMEIPNQGHTESPLFPGAILMTTNCIQKPVENYVGNIFTTGLVAWPGVKHIRRDDFSELIKRARELPGFGEHPGKEITVGFGHHAMLSVSDKVIEAVRQGTIKHFFLIAGCDGAKPGRNYYTEFALKTPKDSIILTLACGKYRFNTLEHGTVGGLPRLLDLGQCNDAYAAVRIAVDLAKAFDRGVNDLPLSFIISWYEQKAVAVLLTLFALGIQNIRLGPSLPAFLSPAVLNFLIQKFNIMPIATPDEDLRAILG